MEAGGRMGVLACADCGADVVRRVEGVCSGGEKNGDEVRVSDAKDMDERIWGGLADS